MNREIKFRVWDKLDLKMKRVCKWNFGYLADIPEVTITNEKTTVDQRFLTHVELMQYTGLTDKNGKEIYEGDIIRYEIVDYDSDNLNSITVQDAVIYREDEFTAYNMWNNPEEKVDWGETEVIGNIYENKELLDEPQ